MELRARIRIRLDSYSFALIIIFLGLFRPVIFPHSAQIVFRVICLIIGLLILSVHLKIRQLVNLSLFYILPIIISCILNYQHKSLSFSNAINGIQYAFCIYEIYTVLELFTLRKREINAAQILCRMSGLYCLVSIIMIIIFGQTRSYFIGSKYMTGYIMMFYLAVKYYIDETKIQNEFITRIRFIITMIIFPFSILFII